jgi:VanZ family protein
MCLDRRLFVLRCTAWSCVALITYLSLIPNSAEVRTSLPPGIEHAVAYAGTAVLMILAYAAWPVWVIAGALSAYSGGMEVLQMFSPGRHPGVDGALWSSAGAIVGAVCTAAFRSRR